MNCVGKVSVEVPFLSTFLLPLLQMYTAPGACRKNFAMLLKRKDRHWRRDEIPLDSDNNAVPEPKKILVLERLSTFRKSASNISNSAIASQKHSLWVLHTVQHGLTAYSLVRPPVQCSMLCMLLCDPASFAYL